MNRAYKAQFQIAIKEDLLNFLTDLFPSSITTLAHISVVILLYAAANQASYYKIFSWSMIVWYVIFTQTITSTSSDVVTEINEGVQNGTIINLLTKPYSYPLSLYSTSLGSSIIGILSTMLLAIPLGLIITKVPFSLKAVLLGLILIFFAITINFLILLCIGLIAFWTEDSKPYYWIYQKLVFVAGGLVFPLEVFPSFAQSIVKMLPPAFILYYPAKLIVLFDINEYWHALGIQIIYVIILSLIAGLMFRNAIKKVSINGG